jgi:hypothetical protein
MALKQGRNWGYWAQNAVKVVKFIKNVCFQWSKLGCMTLKQGPNWGYRAQDGVIIGL